MNRAHGASVCAASALKLWLSKSSRSSRRRITARSCGLRSDARNAVPYGWSRVRPNEPPRSPSETPPCRSHGNRSDWNCRRLAARLNSDADLPNGSVDAFILCWWLTSKRPAVSPCSHHNLVRYANPNRRDGVRRARSRTLTMDQAAAAAGRPASACSSSSAIRARKASAVRSPTPTPRAPRLQAPRCACCLSPTCSSTPMS